MVSADDRAAGPLSLRNPIHSRISGCETVCSSRYLEVGGTTQLEKGTTLLLSFDPEFRVQTCKKNNLAGTKRVVSRPSSYRNHRTRGIAPTDLRQLRQQET